VDKTWARCIIYIPMGIGMVRISCNRVDDYLRMKFKSLKFCPLDQGYCDFLVH